MSDDLRCSTCGGKLRFVAILRAVAGVGTGDGQR